MHSTDAPYVRAPWQALSDQNCSRQFGVPNEAEDALSLAILGVALGKSG
jgi:hypothetical protein